MLCVTNLLLHNIDTPKVYHDNSLLKGVPDYANCDILFVKMYLSSPLFQNQIKNDVSGTAYNALTIEMLKSSLLPLPPLEEQKRIVAKIEELIKYCDEL